MMFKVPIIIRSAQRSDIRWIWRLLHADCQAWTDGMIEAKLPDLWVLTCRDHIICVFHGKATLNKVEDFWIVTHPLYQKKAITSGVEQLMLALFYPPLSTVYQEPSHEQTSKSKAIC